MTNNDHGAQPPADANHDIYEELIDMWRSIVPTVPQTFTHDTSLFSAGGDSLSVLRLIAEARERWGVGASIRDVFAKPTIRTVGELISNHQGKG